jgi:hypothetical protein
MTFLNLLKSAIIFSLRAVDGSLIAESTKPSSETYHLAARLRKTQHFATSPTSYRRLNRAEVLIIPSVTFVTGRVLYVRLRIQASIQLSEKQSPCRPSPAKGAAIAFNHAAAAAATGRSPTPTPKEKKSRNGHYF